MSFSQFLKRHLAAYPAMEPQDIGKLCYQAARGAEHLLSDIDAAARYFYAEFQKTPPRDVPLCEPISDAFCRVDLGAWKAHGLPALWLFRLFVMTASAPEATDLLPDFLATADRIMREEKTGDDLAAWTCFLTDYQAADTPPVHHSDAYRRAYAPAYRLVRTSLLALLPILEEMARRAPENAPLVIAIDGRAASGKTTKAKQLAAITDGAIIHMDDFFLPPHLRTEEQLAEVGGNVHRERFAEEVLPHLSSPDAFSYGVYDCSVGAICRTREIGAGTIRIVEGSYAHHPALGSYAHLKIFSTVEQDEQAARILARNGEAMAERFRNSWIPAEEAYFTAFAIKEAADLVL